VNDRKTILIVEDERVTADSLRIILQREGYNAMVAYSGEDAVGQLAAAQPDLLLIDMILPGMNGMEVAQAACAALPNCRILLFSGQAAASDLLEKGRTEGQSFPILAKPIPPGNCCRGLGRC
jgi:CheY-like chemotaxis protein